MMFAMHRAPRRSNKRRPKQQGDEEEEQQQQQQQQQQSSHSQPGLRSSKRAAALNQIISMPPRTRSLLMGTSPTSTSGMTRSSSAQSAAAMMETSRSNERVYERKSTMDSDLLSVTSEQEESVVSEDSLAAMPSGNNKTSLDTSRTIVLYHPSDEPMHSYGDISLYDSWWQVLEAVHAVWECREMQRLTDSSCQLVQVASRTALRTALLPVTLPLHVVSTSTRLAVNTTHLVVTTAGDVLVRGMSTHESTTEEQGLVHQVLVLPGRVLGLVGHVTEEVGSLVFQLIVGGSSSSSSTAGQSSSEEHYSQHHHSNKKQDDYDDFLDRLRIDYYGDDVPDVSKDKVGTSNKELQPQDDEELSTGKTIKKAVVATSTFLLRVDDLELLDAPNKDASIRILYIDLHHAGHGDKSLTLQALAKLTHAGLSLLANHPTVRLSSKQLLTTPESHVTWKCENGGHRIMRHMSKMTTLERLQTLEKETLVWSGKFTNQNNLGGGGGDSSNNRRSMPLYLARGIIRCSPRAFVNLLWDNERTAEYNNFCLGRRTILDVSSDDGGDSSLDFLTGKTDTATKVIRSETRIPFTNLSVDMACLMHVCPLPDEEGFVIMSRSLNTGTAGTHTSSHSKKSASSSIEDSNKNEIMWGINIIRRVPNHEHLTDLTSLSQGGSSLVPKFVFSKIAMMGIQEFFDNVRKLDLQ